MKEAINSQKLIHILSNKNHNLKQKDFVILKDKIEEADTHALIVSTCKGTSSLGTEEIMLGLFSYWKDFSYDDWVFLIQQMKDHEIGLINLIIFIGRYLHIDLRPELRTVHSSKKEYVLNYIHSKTPLFFYDEKTHSEMLKGFNLLFDESFTDIRNRLLSQGGKEVKVIEPKKIDINSFPSF